MFWGEYMSEQYQEPLKGTTTVGLVFEDGVVLATEKRATMGYMIASKKAKKVYQVAERIGMTTAGGVGDAQQLARILTVECNLYQIRRSRAISLNGWMRLVAGKITFNIGGGVPRSIQRHGWNFDGAGRVAARHTAGFFHMKYLTTAHPVKRFLQKSHCEMADGVF